VRASGGQLPRATWNGFCSVRTRNPQSSKRLAIQFSETDPFEDSPGLPGSSCLGSSSSSRECAYKGYWPGCQRCFYFFPPPRRHLPKSPYLLGPEDLRAPPCHLPFATPDVPSRVVLIRAAARTVNADRTFFRLPVAAVPTSRHPSGFWSVKSPNPRWSRPVNPVTLRWLPCWNA
jgi:hypothetical protein